MPSLNDVRQTITIETKVTGADEAKAAMNAIAVAQDGVSVSSATLTRAQTSVAGSFDRLKASLDTGYRAQQTFEKQTSLVNRALQQGVIGASEHSSAMDLVRQRLEQATKAQDNHTGSVGLNRASMLELGHVAKATFESLAAGAPITQVLAQQGASAAQALSMGGGLSGALDMVGRGAKALLTPTAALVGGIGGVSAAVIIGAKAGLDYADGQERVTKSLVGLGRQSGATVSFINGIAESSASAAKISTSSARDIASQYAATGKIGTGAFGDLIGVTAQYAKATGLELPDATAKLAAAMSDPVKGAQELNQGLGFLTAGSLHLIETLDAQGEHTKAQQVLIQALKPALTDVTELTNGWAVAWGGVKAAAASAYDATGKAIYGAARQPTLNERIVTEANRPKSSEVPWWARIGQDEYSTGTQTRDDSSLAYMQEDARRQGALGMSQMRAGYSATKSLEAKGVIDQLTPSNADILQLTKWETSLKEALAAGDAPSGTEAALKRIKDLIAAGGTETFNLMRSARDAFDQAPLLGYQRGLAQIEAKYRDLRKAAGPGASATTLLGIDAARRSEIGAFNTQSVANPLRDTNQQIEAQIANLGIQRDAFMKGTAAAAEMAARQEEINKFAAQGVDIMKSNADAVNAYAKRAGEAAAANENYSKTSQNIVQGMDQFRSGTQGLLTGAFSDGRQGKNPLQGIVSNLGRMGDQYFDRMISKPLTESLLGPFGKPGGGAIGDLASKGFGDVSKLALPSAITTPMATVTASVVNVQGGIGAGSLTPGGTAPIPGVTSAPVPDVTNGFSGAASMFKSFAPAGATRDGIPLSTISAGDLTGKVSAQYADRFQNLINDLQTKGYNIKSLGEGGYSYRNVAGTGHLSNHATGEALDINPRSNPWGKPGDATVTDFPSDISDMAAKRGLTWGGNWNRPDAMHFQVDKSWKGADADPLSQGSDALAKSASQASTSVSDLSGRLSQLPGTTDDFTNSLGNLGNKLASAGGSGGGGGGFSLGGLFGLGGGGGSGGSAGMELSDGAWLSANGNIMTSRGPAALNRYANGGIANSPQVSIFGEGRTPEAYVPLPDGRSIPVSMKVPAMAANANADAAGAAGGIHAPFTIHQTFTGGSNTEEMRAVAAQASQQAVGAYHKHLERNIGSMVSGSNRRFG